MRGLIYALLDDNDVVVYIGITTHSLTFNRRYRHEDKEYKDIIEIAKFELSEVGLMIEQMLIDAWQPKYNKIANKYKKRKERKNGKKIKQRI